MERNVHAAPSRCCINTLPAVVSPAALGTSLSIFPIARDDREQDDNRRQNKPSPQSWMLSLPQFPWRGGTPPTKDRSQKYRCATRSGRVYPEARECPQLPQSLLCQDA